MKIGIVSLYGWLKIWDNYGTILQNYALQTFLRRHGHETFWIRTRAGELHTQRPAMSVKRAIALTRELAAAAVRPFRGKSWQSRIDAFNAAHPRHFDRFLATHVPHTALEYTPENLRDRPPAADAFIVGSDQVWRDVTPVNFLGFGPSSVRRIAYAVSAPWPTLSAEWMTRAHDAIVPIQFVSVRERDGLEVCARLGRKDAVQTVDPTLLLDREDYLQLVASDSENVSPASPFVLAYFVNVKKLSEVPWNATCEFAASLGAELRVVPLQGTELVIPKDYLVTPSPAQWINAFDKAKCVLTNSFHGALFAVIMRKPFLVLLQTGGSEAQNCRFFSALEPLGLANRVVDSSTWSRWSSRDLTELMGRDIDWKAVESALGEMRTRSADFLFSALSAEPEAQGVRTAQLD